MRPWVFWMLWIIDWMAVSFESTGSSASTGHDRCQRQLTEAARRRAREGGRRFASRAPSMVLSYRHVYHAGNRGDVFKHAVLLDLLRAFTGRAEGRVRVVETHAGAGLYALRAGRADERREWAHGIELAWNTFRKDHDDDDPGVRGPIGNLVAAVARFNGGAKTLAAYPGSPLLTLAALRAQDEARFFELHSSEAPILRWNCTAPGRHVLRQGPEIERADGLAGLREEARRFDGAGGALLGFIDPPYEVKTEYHDVEACVLACAAERPDMTLGVWYPLILGMDKAERMVETLRARVDAPWVDVREQVPARGAGLDRGLWGSGVLVVNPPSAWLERAPDLDAHLQRDAAAAFGPDHVVVVRAKNGASEPGVRV